MAKLALMRVQKVLNADSSEELTCQNPRHPEDRDAQNYLGKTKGVGIRCEYCRNHYYDHGHDYPMRKDGTDATLDDDLNQRRC